MGSTEELEVGNRRYTRREIVSAFSIFSKTFSEKFPKVRFAIVNSYWDKPSFGDMHIVIAGDKMPDGWPEVIDKAFETNKSSRLSRKKSLESARRNHYSASSMIRKTYSFDMDGLQVDLIPVMDESFEFAVNYLSYGDLGRLMGRVYRRLGVRYGISGLRVYPLRENGKELLKQPVTLTTDHAEALRFGGYDPDRFNQGFNTLEEVFEFVASSPFFNPEAFLNYEPKNDRVRASLEKRKNYQCFLQWCRDNLHRLNKGPTLLPSSARLRIFQTFPWAREACEEKVKKLEHKPNPRFSGKLIRSVTGAEGPEMGRVAKFAKKEFESEKQFQDWIMSISDEELQEWFEYRHQQYLESKKNERD